MPGGLNFLDWTGIMDAFEEVGMHRTGHARGHRVVDASWRLVHRLNPGEDRDAMTTAAAAASMLRDKVADVPAHRFLWASAFRLGQGQSGTYRQGRWLLVGDAAHAMGPSAGAA